MRMPRVCLVIVVSFDAKRMGAAMRMHTRADLFDDDRLRRVGGLGSSQAAVHQDPGA